MAWPEPEYATYFGGVGGLNFSFLRSSNAMPIGLLYFALSSFGTYPLFNSLINSLLEEGEQSADLAQIWKQLSKPATSIFHKLGFSSIPSDGFQLDGKKWSEFDFVEKKALHFSPANQLQEA